MSIRSDNIQMTRAFVSQFISNRIMQFRRQSNTTSLISRDQQKNRRIFFHAGNYAFREGGNVSLE